MALTPPLTDAACRVLGVLVEKQATVPDSYPLTLNALLAGCNQKTAREPVLELTEADALHALDQLKARHLAAEGSGHRVPRFEHNMARGLRVPSQATALLALLLLRGPQTAAELRLHAERLHRFADIGSVEAFLQELAEHEPAYVVKLARAPGAREARWAHLLGGEPAVPAAPPTASRGGRQEEDAGALQALQEAVAELQQQVQSLARAQAVMAGELAALRGAAEPPAMPGEA